MSYIPQDLDRLPYNSMKCGNCGAWRDIDDEYIVKRCSSCNDDEYPLFDVYEPGQPIEVGDTDSKRAPGETENGGKAGRAAH